MKRDCGSGELIPTKWVVVSASGQSDDEYETCHDSMELALAEYERRLEHVLHTRCSSVMLYIKDKQGYMNCVKNVINPLTGDIYRRDRTSEI